MPKKFNDESTIKNVIDDYNQGLNRSELHIKYSIGRDVINRILLEAGVICDFKRISPKTIEEIKSLSKTKTSIASISRELSIDGKTVKKILNHYNLNLYKKEEKRKKYSPIMKLENYSKEYILSLLEISMNHATKILGVSDYTIKKYLEKNDLNYEKKYLYVRDIDSKIKNTIAEWYNLGIYTQIELSNIFSLSRRTIKLICKNSNKINTKIIQKDKIKEFQRYSKLCRRLTTITKNHYNLESKDGFHWDHKISLVDGFNWGIPPGLIASKENLMFVSSKENLKKGISSSISKEELYFQIGL